MFRLAIEFDYLMFYFQVKIERGTRSLPTESITQHTAHSGAPSCLAEAGSYRFESCTQCIRCKKKCIYHTICTRTSCRFHKSHPLRFTAPNLRSTHCTVHGAHPVNLNSTRFDCMSQNFDVCFCAQRTNKF